MKLLNDELLKRFKEIGDHCDELGSFSLKEISEYRGQLGLGIERDLFFQPTKLSEVKKQLYGN